MGKSLKFICKLENWKLLLEYYRKMPQKVHLGKSEQHQGKSRAVLAKQKKVFCWKRWILHEALKDSKLIFLNMKSKDKKFCMSILCDKYKVKLITLEQKQIAGLKIKTTQINILNYKDWFFVTFIYRKSTVFNITIYSFYTIGT